MIVGFKISGEYAFPMEHAKGKISGKRVTAKRIRHPKLNKLVWVWINDKTGIPEHYLEPESDEGETTEFSISARVRPGDLQVWEGA